MLLDDVISNGEDACSRMIFNVTNLIDQDIGFRAIDMYDIVAAILRFFSRTQSKEFTIKILCPEFIIAIYNYSY